ncbi:LADA_0H02014g1_1 [Lachancea dasiensis]|uniref:Kinetochore protein SPC25 n=1 Tax=Lachancea dasiensis TaxID=1072105 RepID=A0A1G4JZK4_9SACH|nr:LADA_0H02014g1_1 [Lachancea dasiensis]
MNIDQFVELQHEMDGFQQKLRRALDNHKVNLIKIVDGYKQDVNRLELRQQESKKRSESLKNEEKALREEIETSERQKDENAAQMEIYRLRKQQLETEKDALTRDSNELRDLLSQKQEEVRQQRQLVQNQQHKDLAEVQAYSRILGLEIEAPRPDSLRFVFIRVLESDPTQSCEITIDLSKDEYCVEGSNPSLHVEVCQKLETQLNAHNDLAQFLKASRAALATSLMSSS